MKEKSDDNKKEVEQYLADTLMERPYGFSVGDRHFSLYPVTLGKMYVLQRHVEQLAINAGLLSKDISLEALRLAKEKRDECLHVIYIHTCRTKDEVFDNARLTDTKALFDRQMSDEDIAALMIMVLSAEKTDMFIRHLGIDKEINDMKKVMKVKEKSDKNTFSFGGVSIYGSFIHPLMEIGMTWEEIMWQRSYTNLRLLLADKVNSIYVTDEERKKIRISHDRTKVDAKDTAKMKAIIASQNWD